MKKTVTVIIAAVAAAFAVAMVILLIGSLRIQFMPVPTEYENTVWRSQDGNFTLYVYEYDSNTLQCRSELVYSADGSSFTYQVLDESHGILGLYSESGVSDRWLRTKCDEKSFTVRINRMSSPEYTDRYQSAEIVVFERDK